jgi:hypothetical protein
MEQRLKERPAPQGDFQGAVLTSLPTLNVICDGEVIAAVREPIGDQTFQNFVGRLATTATRRIPFFKIGGRKAGTTIHSETLHSVVIPTRGSQVDHPTGGDANGNRREQRTNETPSVTVLGNAGRREKPALPRNLYCLSWRNQIIGEIRAGNTPHVTTFQID